MGNTASDKSFLDDWSRLEKEGSPGTYTNVWVQKTGNRKQQMLQYPLHVSSEEEITQERQIFQQRHRHPQLVSSLHFVDESTQEFCSSNYQGKIYIESIPLTLQTVTDIPFPDALHIYSQSLQGFHFIASNIVKEPFPVLEQYIGINSEGVCKVWMNDLVERNYPKTNTKISEVAMVRSILQIIEENVDHSSLQGRPSPFDYIYGQSRSPSEVRFDQAINLFRNYVKQFFGNQIPDSLPCVDKVGGVFVLAKNLKRKKNDAKAALRTGQNLRSSQQLPGLSNSSSIPANQTLVYRPYETQQYENNYTHFKREQPIVHQTPVAPVVSQQVNYQRMQTPSFSHSVQQTPNFSQVSPQQTFNGSNVQASRVIVPQQNNRVIPQVVYQNTNWQTSPQVVRNTSQFIPPQPLQGSLVNQIPVNRPPVTFANNLPPQRTEVRESFIQNRVVNSQIYPPQVVPIQQQPSQVNFVQQTIPQPIVVQQPQIVRPPINIVPSQAPVVIQNQQPIPVQTQQFQQVLRKSVITFHGQPQNGPVAQLAPQVVPQVTSTPYQATKTTSVYVTPQVLTRLNVPERVESKTVMINGEVQPKPQTPNEVFVQNDHNVRLRNNEESISSITAKTNAVQSNEHINDKFSSMKEEQIDNSTRNFYTNMLNGEASRTENFSSYYANYTSKLYDNGNETSQNFEVGNNAYVPASNGFKAASDFTESKYKVDLNDGMSSAEFLNELKNLTFGTNNFKKGENNFDYGLTSYQPVGGLDKYTTGNYQGEGLKYDSETYTTTLTDGKHYENDLYVVGRKIDITPLENGHAERLSFQYEEGQTPNGNIRYESEFVKVDGENGSYEEQYYETTSYQSTFQKYAAYDKYADQEVNYGQEYSGLGENLQTQFSRANEQQQQYNGNSPLKQMSEEEYQVDYDPEILADLQKLKGSN